MKINRQAEKLRDYLDAQDDKDLMRLVKVRPGFIIGKPKDIDINIFRRRNSERTA